MVRLRRWIPMAVIALAVTAAGVVFLCQYGKEENLGFRQKSEEIEEGLRSGDADPAGDQTREGGGENVPADPEDTSVCVHVCGSVRREGVFFLTEGMRVADAVDAAGGFTEDADTSYRNLAEPVSDGMKIYIPSLEETASGFVPDLSEDGNGGKVDINSAGLQQLMTLPGIGESRARDIISWREEHGGFTDISDIKKVSGIKDGVFEKIKNLIAVR